MSDPWTQLREILREVAAEVRVDPKRVVPSPLSDPTYNVCVTALTFARLGDSVDQGGSSLRVNHLKLAQFVAARPTALILLETANAARRSIPRGFVSDTIHMSVVSFLVASGTVSRRRDRLISPASGTLSTLAVRLCIDGLFVDERQALERIARLRLTNRALEDL